MIHEVEERISQAPHVLLCVDYDGTLTHFVATPLGAQLSPHMERVLTSLSEHGHAAVAIFSGRDRADLQGRVGIPKLIYAGNHGLEISGPGFLFIEPTAAGYATASQELAEQLTQKLQPIKGAIVEFKGLTVSVHYRQVANEEWETVRHHVHATLAKVTHPFVLTPGEKVFEIRPRVYWNKGSAVGWIKDKLAKTDVLPIYVGDDSTDEDAFAGMQDAITVKVGHVSETAARYKLEGPTEVRKFLEWLDELLERKGHQSEDFTNAARQDAVGGVAS